MSYELFGLFVTEYANEMCNSISFIMKKKQNFFIFLDLPIFFLHPKEVHKSALYCCYSWVLVILSFENYYY